MRRNLSVLLFAACLFVAAVPLAGQSSQLKSPAADIDRLVSSTYGPKGPGAAIIVVKDGQTILRKGYGLADIEMEVPVRPEMVFRIGSVTKQFTSAIVMMLADEGKLSVNDAITKFLPDYPTQGRTITVEHLLTHTSGIVSYTNMPKWYGMMTKDMSLTELIDLFKNEPMEFEPGEKWNYDNSGYILLGAIIEKATGKRYADVVKERIFTPLGMTHSFYGDTAPLIPGRVHGYEYQRGQPVNASYLSMTQPYAAGSLVSSVDDLAVWDAALSKGTLLKPATRDRMFANHSLKSGKKTDYGYGWSLAAYEGHAVVQHGGGINGFTCFVLRVPDEKLYVALLTNEAGGLRTPWPVAQKAAAIAMGKPWAEPPEAKLDAAALEPLVGVYATDGEKYKVLREGSRLVLQPPSGEPVTLLPSSATEFFSRRSLTKATFTKDAKGAVTSMQISGWGVPMTLTRTAEPVTPPVVAVDPKIYDLYAGEYELAPGFSITISRNGNRLLAQATGQGPFEILPASETRYFAAAVGVEITFVKDADGKVTRLVLRQGGRDVPGKKIR